MQPMTSAEIDAAMRHRVPVICNGTRYDRIIEYVSWYDGTGKRRLSVTLMLGRNSYRFPADKVSLADKE